MLAHTSPGWDECSAVSAGSSSNGHSIRWLHLSLCVAGGTEPPERLVLPEQFEALEQPRRDLRSGDGDADGLGSHRELGWSIAGYSD